MDVKGIFSNGKVKGPISITAALTSAVLEWVLMIFLFIDGGFAYLVTKFARYCQLQVPCLLCSRLDHVLGKERAGFYWDLICPTHKLKVSSLVLCHNHNNLVDVHGMCESCLFSFATVNKSNAESYKLLVGKLGADPHLVDEGTLVDVKVKDPSGIKKCYCCKEECVSRVYAQKLFQITSSGSNAVEVDAPLTVTNVPERGDAKKIENDPSLLVFDPLPHLDYKKVKVSSDSESEAAHSDSDSVRSLIRVNDYSENYSYDQSLHPEPQTFTGNDGFVTEKVINLASVPEPALLDPEIDFKSRDCSSSTTAAAAVGLVLEEFNCHQAKLKTDASATSDLVTFDEVNHLYNGNVDQVDVTRETSGEIGNQVVKDCCDVSRARSDAILNSETDMDSKAETNEVCVQTAGSFDLGDAYKLAVGNRGKQLSGKFLEQLSFKESTRMSEDLKLLLTQLSAARGTDTILSEMSPRGSLNCGEVRTSDVSSSIGMQILQRRISLERNESGLSPEGSAVSEIEGESLADRFKRQVEYDRKLMAALYTELEEEINASAVAAHQAMAMITRLQEEKAAFQMEGLQCLRMLEEQAEYDDEALQKANELLAQKEKEIQDFEADVELYKKKLGIEVTTSFGDVDIDKRSPILDFESERQQILQCLIKLEERLYLFSKHAASHDSANVNCEFSSEEWVDVGNPKEFDPRGDFSRNNCKMEENVRLEPIAEDATIHFGGEVSTCFLQEGSGSVQCFGGDSEFETLKKGISLLSSRLKALETEHSFLENSINSLRKGDEGLKFIEEIAGHLRQLHFIWDRTNSGIARK